MDPKEEFERYEPKGEFPPKHPHEPFANDEMLEPSAQKAPSSLKSLHLPKAPITKEKLSNFLIELQPIIEEIQSMTRKYQHILSNYLQNIKNILHSENFSDEALRLFEQITDHFNDLLTHSAPVDQTGVLAAIKDLKAIL